MKKSLDVSEKQATKFTGRATTTMALLNAEALFSLLQSYLPECRSGLISGLSHLNMNNLTHDGRKIIVLSWSFCCNSGVDF
jgi:hypothetical protein